MKTNKKLVVKRQNFYFKFPPVNQGNINMIHFEPVKKTKTYEGGPAVQLPSSLELRRAVVSCMLFEDTFYESGQDIADRIVNLVKSVPLVECFNIAVEAKEKFKIRHAPLLIVAAMALSTKERPVSDNGIISKLIERVVVRPDEMGELLAIYCKINKMQTDKIVLSNQIKKGLANVLSKFDAYQLSKWDRDSASIKLRDVIFLCHPKPKSQEEANLFAKVCNKTFFPNKYKKCEFKPPKEFSELEKAKTWERGMSSGEEKKSVEGKKIIWENLLLANKIGATALLKNLRNMTECGVDKRLIVNAIESMKVDKILPFEFFVAAKYAPSLVPYLDCVMIKKMANYIRLPGKTVIVLDVSGSMFTSTISAKSILTRCDAAATLSVIIGATCDKVDVYTFSNNVVEVPYVAGMSMIDRMIDSQDHSNTYLGDALNNIHMSKIHYDRIVVLTDEQAHDEVGDQFAKIGYMINVATYERSVAYGKWVSINGFSEAVLDYINCYEDLIGSEYGR